MSAATTAGGLLLGDKYGAFRRAPRGRLHGVGIGGSGAKAMLHFAEKNGALELRLQGIGKQQVWNLFEGVASGGVPFDGHAVSAKLLHHPPHRRAADVNLRRQLGAAHHHHSVSGEHFDDAAQAVVRRETRSSGLGLAESDASLWQIPTFAKSGRKVGHPHSLFANVKRPTSAKTGQMWGTEYFLLLANR